MDGGQGKNKGELYGNLKELIVITSDKRHRLYSLLKMTQMQRTAIEEMDLDLLAKYLGEKQRHIDAIDALDVRFTEIYGSDIKAGLADGGLGQNDPNVRGLYAQLQTLISDVQEIIKAIHSQEESNNTKAQEAMEDLKQKIGHIQTGKKGHSAYTQTHDISEGMFIDQKK
ncbi:MAG TPA: flagellar export chaperone FlgN [Clostridia bacterium]|nr:flagellar export chaperone FlgN [Clostridia bacterium]